MYEIIRRYFERQMLSLDIDERRGEFFNAMAFYVIRKEFVEPLRTKVDGRELKNILDAANDSEMRIGNNAYSAAFMNETEMKTLAAQAGLLWKSVVLSDDVLCPKIVCFLCAARLRYVLDVERRSMNISTCSWPVGWKPFLRLGPSRMKMSKRVRHFSLPSAARTNQSTTSPSTNSWLNIACRCFSTFRIFMNKLIF
jgi:hypothetical protein